MKAIYQVLGTSRQNLHQRLKQHLTMEEEKRQVMQLIKEIREEHPQMGAKVLYEKIQPQKLGRDRFINFYNSSGFTLAGKKPYRSTTSNRTPIRFTNLIATMELTGVNQVFVSDITYYELADKFYYLTFITDLFSRKIKGYSSSKSLKTEATTIAALQMVLKQLDQKHQAIFHSDGGGQYYCKSFLQLTKGKFKNSMCESVYQNAHAERVNGIIKNDYLKHYQPSNFKQLTSLLKKAVNNYNNHRPHQALLGYTPDEFEQLSISNQQKIALLTKEKKKQKKKNTTLLC